ncbi:hypothetical protein [Filibacter tadaridae]|uniref:hypothetical protein n=1 Tax=Filibacter tadaridae TaxID=2483811 RepID=UPI00193A29F3|nr:hypothetical protein [Filibacter tadaridae]
MYDLTKHPRYKFHLNGEKYWFDIDKYLAALRKQQQAKRKNSAVAEPIKQEVKLSFTSMDGSVDTA